MARQRQDVWIFSLHFMMIRPPVALRALRTSWTRAAALVVMIAVTGCTSSELREPPLTHPGSIIYDRQSAFSHVRVRQYGTVRTLLFVEESGEEVRQTSMDLARPGKLLIPYTRYLFASHLLCHPQDRVLLVGLGGGAIFHFIAMHFPDSTIDAVEIDPVVVDVARELFGTRSGPRRAIHTMDAFDFIQRIPATQRYGTVYMDAFLEPDETTGSEGIPKHFQTVRFLKSLHRYLEPGGVVTFNLIQGEDSDAHIRAVRSAFNTVYRFDVPDSKNIVLLATQVTTRKSMEDLVANGHRLDASSTRTFGFSFASLATALSDHEAD